MHIAEAVRPGTKLHKLALTSKGPGATSCISNPIGSSNSPDPGKTRANISLMMGAAEHGAGTEAAANLVNAALDGDRPPGTAAKLSTFPNLQEAEVEPFPR
mmetsp:Transcript_23753/g.49335  ORF Transcript_23753/g.49335 Transcript_23753/m.49335 type:complete len:101 (-) Transcript_23753:714-1016(-)